MRETKDLELKEKVTNSFLKTVSAFANYGSGRVIFGISDSGKIVGIDNLDKACLAIENKINDSIDPVPAFSIEPNKRNKTITLLVECGSNKPYFYKSKAYRRGDSSTVEVGNLELKRLILAGQNMTFDQMESSASSLSFKTLGVHIKKTIGVNLINDDILKTLELKGANGKYNVAAELLSDENPYPGVDIARFGDSISIFKERETHENESVLLQYEHAIEMFARNYKYEVVRGSKREARELIPEQAFREAVANALVHRQWDVSACIRISMFEDKIEVVSPGGLVFGITEQEYLEGQVSILRNPILGNVFYRLGIIERFGTGVLRIKEAYRDSLAKPSFQISENSIKVVLPVVQHHLNLSEDEAAVLQIVEGRTLPIGEISAAANFSKSKTHSILKRLAKQGYVSIAGAGRGTKYRGLEMRRS